MVSVSSRSPVACSNVSFAAISTVISYRPALTGTVVLPLYEIKADVTEGINYLPAILTLGNFKIYEELSVGISSALKKSHLNAYISNNLLYVSPEATSVRLMSINGATIFETKGMGRTYNVGMLSDGIYLVLMRNGWEVRTVKVMK